MPLVVSEPLDPREIAGSARWLAQAYDAGSGLVRFVAMERLDYRDAAFLDDRIFQQWRDVRVLPWQTVEASMAVADRRDARWIFHIGHVGSTLVARMLGELDHVLALREPRILRDLALLAPAERAGKAPTVGGLCARSYAPGDATLVKATSFISEIAPLLVAAGEKAAFIYAGPRSYIETILAGENSVKELHALEEFRGQRIAGRVPSLADTSDARRAAMAWACEMTALEAAAEALPGSVRWVDFDTFLECPADSLGQLAGHFSFKASRGEIECIAEGPLMTQYSKDPSYEYSPGLRRELQSDARRMHGADIDSALAMLGEAGQSSPLLKRALDRSAGREWPGEIECIVRYPC